MLIDQMVKWVAEGCGVDAFTRIHAGGVNGDQQDGINLPQFIERGLGQPPGLCRFGICALGQLWQCAQQFRRWLVNLVKKGPIQNQDVVDSQLQLDVAFVKAVPDLFQQFEIDT